MWHWSSILGASNSTSSDHIKPCIFQFGVAFWRVVLREIYFEGPNHIWWALKTSILNTDIKEYVIRGDDVRSDHHPWHTKPSCALHLKGDPNGRQTHNTSLKQRRRWIYFGNQDDTTNSGELQNLYKSFCRRKAGAFCKIEESKCAKLSKAQSTFNLILHRSMYKQR
jgi:hypothetical protein